MHQHKWFYSPDWSEGTRVCICGAKLGRFYKDILFKANENECVVFFNHINQIPSCPLDDNEKLIKTIIE